MEITLTVTKAQVAALKREFAHRATEIRPSSSTRSIDLLESPTEQTYCQAVVDDYIAQLASHQIGNDVESIAKRLKESPEKMAAVEAALAK